MASARTPGLNEAVSALRGVGPGVAAKLERLSVHTVGDLLFLLPNRYIDRTHLTPIGSLEHGRDALVQGTVEITQIRFGRRRSLLCHVSDNTGALLVRFFHFTRFQQSRLVKGVHVRCWGRVRRTPGGPEMVHPEYEIIDAADAADLEKTLTPVYPGTEGIGQRTLRKLTDQALGAMQRKDEEIRELIPDEILRELKLPRLVPALRYVHRPPVDADTGALLAGIHPAQRRLAVEELLAHQIGLRRLRSRVRLHPAPGIAHVPDGIASKLETSLSFELTRAQRRCLAELRGDLARDRPMMRLLQGDVGSGKTVIAALAAAGAIQAGWQVALMAPTELLADQHCRTFRGWFDALDVRVRFAASRLRPAERAELQSELASERPLIAVGTHALFQDPVSFGRLGLVVIDEQHRFGVEQRFALMSKGASPRIAPHQLIMTATPIPRTLAMTLFADLDISVIDEMPPGRLPVRTTVLSSDRRGEITERIAAACARGQQAYWVCTLVEESESLQAEAATDTHSALAQALPDLRVGLVHGRMKPAEKDAVMRRFRDAELDLLVATTVIEVGVDVAQADLMIIENAERLGLSQLHQLRGRVGRSHRQSDCVLIYQAPLSEMARARLEVMRTTTDGFRIAEKDLELRGPGDILGSRQTGLPEMRIASLVRDARLLPVVQHAADRLIETRPELCEALLRRWVPAEFRLAGV